MTARSTWASAPCRCTTGPTRGAGLAEIGRVLRPGGQVLIWDFRLGTRPHPFGPRHAHLPDPAEHLGGRPLRMVNATPWRWPWRFALTQRIELVHADGAPGHAGP